MQIGVLTFLFAADELPETLARLDSAGVDAVELGSPSSHLDTDALLDDPDAQADFQDLLDEYSMDVSALAGHNNPIHPDEETARANDKNLRDAIRLAGQLDVGTVTCFSGLPGGAPGDSVPNWITAPWPPEHADALEYQWEEVAIPYWSEVAEFAETHDVDIAIEMHPNMLVSEPHSMQRLRDATNERIGANFDPSHLYWQGIDVCDAVQFLGEDDGIHHVHAKDTKVYEANARTKGVLDTAPYTDEPERSWLFRSIGYGHGEAHWKDLVSTLRMVGYEGTISIEHEDSLTSGVEGLEKAIDILERAVFETQPGDAYWA